MGDTKVSLIERWFLVIYICTRKVVVVVVVRRSFSLREDDIAR